MNNILKARDLRNFKITWNCLLKNVVTIATLILVIVINLNNISIEKIYITIISFLSMVLASCLGGITSGILTSIIFLFGLEIINDNITLTIVISSIISKAIIIGCIWHTKTFYLHNNSGFKNEKSLYKYILDFVIEGILLTKNDKILYLNDSYKKYFDIKKIKAGTSIFDYISYKNEKELDKFYKSLQSSKRNEEKVVFEHIGNDNTHNLIEVKSKKIDDEDTVLTVANIITERVKRIEFIKEGKKRYKQILSILPLGVLIHVNDKIIFANNKVTKMLKYGNYKFVIGEDIKRHIKHNYRNAFNDSLNHLKHESDMKLIEMEMIDMNGEVLTVNAINSIIPFEKKAVLTIIKDVTEEKRKEEKKLILEETITYEKVKSEFLANISHDIKTPINVIYSSLQIIDSSIKTGKLKDEGCRISRYTNIMKQNCYRGLKIANNLIDLSRYEMNGFELNLEKINIVNIVEDIITEVAKISNEKNIQLVFDTEDEEIICYVDRIKIERLLLNLLSNSIKFTKQDGEVLVFITTKKDSIIITVKDNGIGIPKNRINYIFDRFKQIDKSFTRSNEGSGLGLSVVKAIVNLHGGSIKVESEEGLGTEVSVLLYKRDEDLTELSIDDFFKDYNEMINIEFSDIYL